MNKQNSVDFDAKDEFQSIHNFFEHTGIISTFSTFNYDDVQCKTEPNKWEKKNYKPERYSLIHLKFNVSNSEKDQYTST